MLNFVRHDGAEGPQSGHGLALPGRAAQQGYEPAGYDHDTDDRKSRDPESKEMAFGHYPITAGWPVEASTRRHNRSPGSSCFVPVVTILRGRWTKRSL